MSNFQRVYFNECGNLEEYGPEQAKAGKPYIDLSREDWADYQQHLETAMEWDFWLQDIKKLQRDWK